MFSRSVALACLVAALAFPQLGASSDASGDLFKALSLTRLSPARAAKDFSAPALKGRPVKLADLKGRVVLLNFWATWCPPCKEEMPSIERLYRRFNGRGFTVVALSVDSEGASVVAPFVKTHGLTFPVALDSKIAVAERYGVRGLPTTFLIDRRGNLVAMALGPREWDGPAARSLVEHLLKEES